MCGKIFVITKYNLMSARLPECPSFYDNKKKTINVQTSELVYLFFYIYLKMHGNFHATTHSLFV